MMRVDKLWCNGFGERKNNNNKHFQYLSVVSNNLYQGAGSVCQNLVLGYHKTCFSWGFAEKWKQAQCKIRTFSFLSFLHLAILSWQKLQWFLLAARVESSINRIKKNQENKAEWLTFGFDATNIFHLSLSTFFRAMAGLGHTMSISMNKILWTSWSQQLPKPLIDHLRNDQASTKKTKITSFISFSS